MTVIETERLVLRPWREGDAPRLLDIHTRRDVVQWLSDDFDNPTYIVDLEDARGRIQRFQSVFDTAPHGIWALERRADAIVAGAVLLKPLPDNRYGEIEIGWWLHPDSHHQGYATEAAHAILDRAFTHGLAEVWAVMYPANVASGAVIRRLGMTDLGVHERWYPGESQVFRLRAADRSG